MKITENLFFNSFEKQEKYLQEDFKVLTSDIQILSARSTANNGMPSVRELIGLLQYQDVIGQKIQHIQKINGIFEEETRQLNAGECADSIVPDLLLLMMKLNRLAMDEYNQVVRQIRAVFQQLNVQNLWNEENYLLFYEENLFLRHKLKFFYKQMKKQLAGSAENPETIRQKFQKVYQSFSMESERRIYRSVIRNRSSLSSETSREGASIEPGHIDLF